jgi:23S rRNA (cytidine2498-2'-O)-methyltransferase
MHLLLWAEDSETELRQELAQAWPGAHVELMGSSMFATEFDLVSGARLPHLAFARQWMPNARAAQGESIRAWAGELFETITRALPEDQPWSLHLEPHYSTRRSHRIGARAWHTRARAGESAARAKSEGGPGVGAAAGRHRCQLIREALLEFLQRKRRHLLRQLRREPVAFTAGDSLVQLLLTGPAQGFISAAVAPLPFEQRHLLSPFPKGELAPESDPSAPSRAFTKLLEAERRLGRAITAGEECVDLGAAPGSWTYLAVNRGARVIAVDRSPLRTDLMAHPRVEFRSGDAFRFQPPQPVDWLLCDVIAPSERTGELLEQWLRRRWCRQFVVTLKLKDAPGADALVRLRQELPSLAAELYLTRLCANKKEVCAFGVRV